MSLLLQLLESLPKLVLILLVVALFRADIYLILLVVGITNIPAAAELFRAPRAGTMIKGGNLTATTGAALGRRRREGLFTA